MKFHKPGILLIFLLLIVLQGGHAQSPDEIIGQLDSVDFEIVRAKMNQYYSDHPTVKGRKQWSRLEYYLVNRQSPNGPNFNREAQNLKAYLKVKQRFTDNNRAPHGSWLFYGPSTIPNTSMGRINCVDFSPTNSNTIFAGSSSGGVWKSTNGGNTWANISPNIPCLAIADLEVDPNNPNVIYVMTGDGGNRGRPSIGMLKTTNGGASWYLTDLQFNTTEIVYAEKLLMSSTSANTQFVATTKGLYKTSNGWSDLGSDYLELSGLKVFDVEFAPDDESILYATSRAFYPLSKSTNGGLTWPTIVDNQLSTILGNADKVEIAVTPDDPDCIYILGGHSSATGILRSLNEGVAGSWEIRDTSLGNLGGQSSYNMGLAVDSSDYNNIFAGLVASDNSPNGGLDGSWISHTGYLHNDVHETKFHNDSVYQCNDGGLFKSSDDGLTYRELSQGMEITEYYTVAGTPEELGLLYAGAQDNGTMQRTAAGNFKMVMGNDGTACMINYNNSDTAYTSHNWGYVQKTYDGGSSWSSLTIPEGGEHFFFMPMVMDPVNPNVIFHGVTKVYRSDNGMEPGSFEDLGKPADSGYMDHIAQGKNNRNRLYVSSGNKLYRTDDALTNSGPAGWTLITTGLSDTGSITCIAVDPDNSNHVYVTKSGYFDGIKVYYSSQGGDPNTWQNISGSLPNVPVNCIRMHDNGSGDAPLYIGTDIGVFYRDNNLGDWTYFSNYMPAVRVNDIYIYDDLNLLVAATFGRGLWLSASYTTCNTDLNITSGSPGQLQFSASQTITSTAVYPKDISSNVRYSAGDRVDFMPGFNAGATGILEASIGPCAPPFSPLSASDNLGGILVTTGKNYERFVNNKN